MTRTPAGHTPGSAPPPHPDDPGPGGGQLSVSAPVSAHTGPVATAEAKVRADAAPERLPVLASWERRVVTKPGVRAAIATCVASMIGEDLTLLTVPAYAEQVALAALRAGARLQGGPVASLSEGGLADRLLMVHGEMLLFCGDRERHPWLSWDNVRYRPDTTQLVQTLAASVIRGVAGEAEAITDVRMKRGTLGFAVSSDNRSAVRGVLELAAPKLAVDLLTLDDPAINRYLLVTEQGTLDLRTGALVASDRDRRNTKMAKARFDPTATREPWEKFLAKIQPDPAKRSLLKRAVGAAALGVALQKILWLLGEGGNGKGTFVETIANEVLGPDYAVRLNRKAIIHQEYESSHEEGIMRLEGRRFASVMEPSGRLNWELLKELSGGELMSGRRIHGFQREFAPTWLLFIATNKLPEITDVDRAIERRFLLVSFDEQLDESWINIKTELATCASGILNWVIEGAREYLDEGLNPPASALAETSEFLNAADHWSRFYEETFIAYPGADYPRVAASIISAEYHRWCSANYIRDKDQLNMTAIGRKLGIKWHGDEPRHKSHKDGHGRMLRCGLELRSETQARPSDQHGKRADEASGQPMPSARLTETTPHVDNSDLGDKADRLFS